MMPSLFRWFGKFVFALAMGTAAWWSVRVARADREAGEGSVVGLKRASALLPEDAEYPARIAALISDNDPSGALSLFRRAAELDPWDSRIWIEIGLLSEAQGDFHIAEKALLRAAAVDRQYLPRWTLMNFYFRRDDTAQFWQWAKKTAQMEYDNGLPLFRLCGKVEEDGNLIGRLGIRQPDVRRAYLGYLLDQKRLDLVGPAVQILLGDGTDEDAPVLLQVCDRFLEQKRVTAALEIWNGLARSGRIPYAPFSPEHANLITNAAFRLTPLSHGFDWNLPSWEGITPSAEETPNGFRFSFSGREPEYAVLITQLFPVMAGNRYEFRSTYRTSGIGIPSGLNWRVTNTKNDWTLAEFAGLSAEDETEATFSFVAPANCDLARLSLIYQRALGTTRIEGSAAFHNLAIVRVAY